MFNLPFFVRTIIFQNIAFFTQIFLKLLLQCIYCSGQMNSELSCVEKI